MKITLKLFASLQEHLPPGAKDYSTPLEIDATTTPFELIDRFNIPRRFAHLVVLNGVYLTPEERDRPVFKDGDVLAIWPPVAGG